MDDLISRAESVKAALDLYHTLAEKRDDCQQKKDLGGTVMWTAAENIAQAMVCRLMELPAVDAMAVVRCANCIFGCSIPEQPRIIICGNIGISVPLDYWCAFGRAMGGETSAAE